VVRLVGVAACRKFASAQRRRAKAIWRWRPTDKFSENTLSVVAFDTVNASYALCVVAARMPCVSRRDSREHSIHALGSQCISTSVVFVSTSINLTAYSCLRPASFQRRQRLHAGSSYCDNVVRVFDDLL
jgi:hypothetical protein